MKPTAVWCASCDVGGDVGRAVAHRKHAEAVQFGRSIHAARGLGVAGPTAMRHVDSDLEDECIQLHVSGGNDHDAVVKRERATLILQELESAGMGESWQVLPHADFISPSKCVAGPRGRGSSGMYGVGAVDPHCSIAWGWGFSLCTGMPCIMHTCHIMLQIRS